MKFKQILLTIAAVTFLVVGCKKDESSLLENQSDPVLPRYFTNAQLQPTQDELSAAKQLFDSQINNLSTIDESGPALHVWNKILPVWDEGKIVDLSDSRLVFIPTINGMNKSNLQIVYSKNEANEENMAIMGFWEASPGQSYDNFSGSIFEVSRSGFVNNGIEFKNGNITGFFRSENIYEENGNNLEPGGGTEEPAMLNLSWLDRCLLLECELKGPDCACEIGVGYHENEHPLSYYPGQGEDAWWSKGEPYYIVSCAGSDCYSWNPDAGPTETDADGSGLEEDGQNNGGTEVSGGSGDGSSYGDLDNDLTKIIANLMGGVNPHYESCEDNTETNDEYQPFAVTTIDYDQFLNLNADVIISKWGNNSGAALINALDNPTGNIANAIYTANNAQNIEYDESNLVHTAVLSAIEALIANINNANGDCGAIMTMGEFAQLLNEAINQQRENLQNWLNDHPLHQQSVDDFLDNHPNDPGAQAHVDAHVFRMIVDDEYREAVEESFSWGPIMWEIAAELLGDKGIDIIINLIPGLKNQDEVRDAVKAFKNGDWIELTYNLGKLVAGNTPVGQFMSALEAANKVRHLIKTLNKVWDKIGNLGEAAIERLWNVAKKSPLKFNENYLKYVDDLASPTLGHAPGAPALVQGANSSQFYRYQVFKANFPEVDMNDLQVHHAFPQSLGWRFPTLGLTGEQIHSFENLRGIRNTTTITLPDGTQKGLHSHITTEWEDFLQPFEQAGTVPDFQQLTAFAQQIDDSFGHLFDPIIR